MENYNDWLIGKYMDEVSLQYRTVWDIYIKFYSVFLTFNGAALALTVQYVTNPTARYVVGTNFIIHNVLSAITAYKIAGFSRDMQRRSEEIAKAGATEKEPIHPSLKASPLAGALGHWGAMGNFFSHLALIVLWGAVMFISTGAGR